MSRVWVFLTLSACAFAQNVNKLTVVPGVGDSVGEIKFRERRANGANDVTIKAPDTLSADYALTLPVDNGEADECLVTNGSGVLSWEACGSSGGYWSRTAGSDFTRLKPSTIADSVNIGTDIDLGAFPYNLLVYNTASGAGEKKTRMILRAGEDQGFQEMLFIQAHTGEQLGGIDAGGAFFSVSGSTQPSGLGTGGLMLGNGAQACWSQDANRYGVADICLYRDGADALALRDAFTGSGLGFMRLGGLHADSATAYVKSPKFEVRDDSASAVFWDIQLDYGAGANNDLKIRDNAGNDVIRFSRMIAGSAQSYASLDMSFSPKTDSARDLGDVNHSWRKGFVDTLNVSTICGSSSFDCVGNPVDFVGTIRTNVVEPAVDDTYDWGANTKRPKKLWVKDLDISGTCTGCSGSLFTDGGATTYLTATGDNLSIGGSSTIAKLQLAGNGTSAHGLQVDAMTDRGLWFTGSGFGNAMILDNTSAGTVWKSEGGTHTNFIDLFGAGFVTYFLNLSGSGDVIGDFIHGPAGGTSIDFYRAPIRVYGDAAGVHVDSATGYVKSTKFEFRDDSSSSVFWDAQLQYAPGGSNDLVIRDNAGADVLRLSRQVGGSAQAYASLDMSLSPTTDFVRNLGDPTHRWGKSNIDLLNVSVISGGSSFDNIGNPVDVKGTLRPSAHNTYHWGGSSQRPAKLWVVDLDISGTCTGCPSGGGSKWTDGGATTYLTATGDNLAIGGTSTSHKLYVAGAIGLDGDLLPTAGNGITDLGTRSARLGSVVIDSGNILELWDGSFQRIKLGTSGNAIAVTDSGGTLRMFVGASTGSISTAGSMNATTGFSNNGNSGLSVTLGLTKASGGGDCVATYSGGILTSTTCN